MNAEVGDTTTQQLQALMEKWMVAARSRDLKAIMSCYTDDVVAFDAIIQLQFKGADAYGKHWAMCMEMCGGEMIFEPRDLTIAASGDVGYGHYLMRCGAKDADGTEKSSWMRCSVGFRRTGGQWAIAHEHFSAPFDMESGKALFDLKP
ncbi:nuclear transport factor 2 family protein [Cupriavidus respiraculi]|uniref:SnoaL-like domain-containing protein n=1 Tax=Cupriavidus respiraculi TaxID=195930 RepID=A0ABM8WUA0_9BURK|nr:nuclear transport factor 2 family protein [Cupriavidus respiraculi]CAG9171063.1 hypothetical protein LMG21510_01541 [Cupriavidus respiraculi]